MITRIITNAGDPGDPLVDGSGNPLVNTLLEFFLVDEKGKVTYAWDVEGKERIAPGPVRVYTDENGEFSIPLWPTSRGDKILYWLSRVASKDISDVMAPLLDGVGSIHWADWAAGGTPPTPAQLDVLAAHLTNASLHYQWRDAWDAETDDYKRYDAVSHGGSSWKAKQNVPAGTVPVEGEYWTCIAAKGADSIVPGPAGTIESASATQLAAGSLPTVTLGGTPSARTMVIGLPAGNDTMGYATQVELYADLAPVNRTVARVDDPDPTKRGLYRKSGASGAGSWIMFQQDDNILITVGAGKNLFNPLDPRNLVNNILASNGAPVPGNNGWTLSYFIPVSGNTAMFGNTIRFVAEYDVAKVFIGGTFQDINPNADRGWITNANARYIRVCMSTALVSTRQIEASAVKTAFEAFTPTVKTTAGQPIKADESNLNAHIGMHLNIRPGGKNLNNIGAAALGVYLTADGTTPASSFWDTSDYIPVTPGLQYSAGMVHRIAQYDANKVFIAGTYVDNTSPQHANTTITAHASAAFARFTTLAATYTTPLQVEQASACTSFEAYAPGLYFGNQKIGNIGGGDTAVKKLVDHVDYDLFVDRAGYQIFKPIAANGTTSVIKAVFRDIAVAYKGGTFSISTKGISGPWDYTVAFDAAHFPNLLAASGLQYVMILPFTRNFPSSVTSQAATEYRIVVITDKGQVYHNFPARAVGSDGAALANDIITFDESVIWDLPVAERLFPSTNAAAVSPERYFPGLPATNYDYHPGINADNGFGHGGWNKSVTLNAVTYPRFYIPTRAEHSLAPMGGFEPGDKITLVGTYRNNQNAAAGARICVFATDDGGRTWFVKYEFGDGGDGPNWSNDINTSALASAYTLDSFQMVKRSSVYPTAVTKEPATKFAWDAPVIIKGITRAAVAVAETETAHGLTTGHVIAIQDNPGSGATSADWDWMRNDTVSTTSGGNGILFKVEVVDATHFKLHEYAQSAQNNLSARHVHHINAQKDGWIIGTGETYPYGWLLFMQMKEADNFGIKRAYDTFDTYRLNSASAGIQRTLGAVLRDDADQTLFLASDHATLARANIALPSSRTDIVSRGSTGIFKGKLADIDSIDSFRCIYDATQPAYFFKEIRGNMIFCGQRGELAISTDGGATWQQELLGDQVPAQHFYGEAKKIVVIDQYVIAFK